MSYGACEIAGWPGSEGCPDSTADGVGKFGCRGDYTVVPDCSLGCGCSPSTGDYRDNDTVLASVVGCEVVHTGGMGWYGGVMHWVVSSFDTHGVTPEGRVLRDRRM